MLWIHRCSSSLLRSGLHLAASSFTHQHILLLVSSQHHPTMSGDLSVGVLQTPPETRLLPDCPTDGITALEYVSESLLVSTSWDGSVRVHHVSSASTTTTSTTATSGSTLDTGGSLPRGVCWSHAFGVPLLSLATAAMISPATTSASTDNNNTSSTIVALFVGGLDGSIHQIHLTVSRMSAATEPVPWVVRLLSPPRIVGQHDGGGAAVSCVRVWQCGPTAWLLGSAGWDCKFQLWEVQITMDPSLSVASSSSASASASKSLVALDLPGKSFSMDVTPNRSAGQDTSSTYPLPRFVIATSGRRIVFVDIQRLAEEGEALPDGTSAFDAKLVLDRESSLKYQTRSIRCFPDGTGLAVASIEGRVAIEYLQSDLQVTPHPHSGGGKKYAFKCHRQGDLVYPVNCLAFRPPQPSHGGPFSSSPSSSSSTPSVPHASCTFATGGCDGVVTLWDGFAKRKLLSLSALPTSIAALSFSPSGMQLAIASSYTFEEGEREHPRDEIYVRPIYEWELQPKQQ